MLTGWRKWLSAILLVLLALSVACAQPGAKPAGKTSEKISITWLTHDYQPWKETLASWIDQYTAAHPNVEITHVTSPQNEMVTKMVTSFEAGKGDTIIGAYGPWLATLAEGGYLDEAPDDIAQMVKDEFLPLALEGASYKGKLYGVIQQLGTPLPLLNVGVFEAAGIPEAEYPDTYEELLAILPRLDKKDASGNWEVQGACLLSASMWTPVNWSSVLFSYGGQILDDTLTKAAFNTPEGLEATKVWKQISYPDADETLFTLDKCGMIWRGSWMRPRWKAQNPDLKAKALRPFAGPAGRWHSNYVWNWVVNDNATPEQKEVAWDFIKFITDVEQQWDLWEAISLMPTRKAMLESETAKADEFLLAFGQHVNETKIYYSQIPEWEQVDNAIIAKGQLLLAGELTEQEFLDQLEKEVNDILAGK